MRQHFYLIFLWSFQMPLRRQIKKCNLDDNMWRVTAELMWTTVCALWSTFGHTDENRICEPPKIGLVKCPWIFVGKIPKAIRYIYIYIYTANCCWTVALDSWSSDRAANDWEDTENASKMLLCLEIVNIVFLSQSRLMAGCWNVSRQTGGSRVGSMRDYQHTGTTYEFVRQK